MESAESWNIRKGKSTSTFDWLHTVHPGLLRCCAPATKYSTVIYEENWQNSVRNPRVKTKEGNENLAKDDVIELEGIVTDALPNAMFSVDIGNGHIILAHISGKLRMNFIKILPGDKVTVQMSPYDLTRGRITWRSK